MLVSVILLWVLILLRDSLAWMSLALGLAAGWAAGILLAPYQSEQDRFREYLKIVSSFLAGYSISKMDRLFDLWLDPARGPLALTSIFAHRALVCALRPSSWLRFQPTSGGNMSASALAPNNHGGNKPDGGYYRGSCSSKSPPRF